MNLYVENKSFSFIKKAVRTVKENTGKDIFKLFVICNKGGFSGKACRFARKRQKIYDVEYVIYGEKGLGSALKYLNKNKRPISLTFVIDKPISAKAKKTLLTARKEIKIIDTSGCEENVNFYRSFYKILYKTNTEDLILDADVMHLYKFYETVFQCKFSSCLGQNIYVTEHGSVHFCPLHLNDSLVGALRSNEKYFDAQCFKDILHTAIEKRDHCQSTCEYFDYCSGACPLEDGCCNFPELFKKNKARFDEIVQNNKPLTDQNFVVAKIIVKDIAYGE
jgi:radical SAM protein with 4Fe4S-binding SPASM domain